MPDTFSTCTTSTFASEDPAGGAVLGLFGPWQPPITLTLPIAERVRAALMRASGSAVPWQISGKDELGRPRRGHDHLYVLPFSSQAAPGSRQVVDRVLLWASSGLHESTLTVLDRLHQVGGWIRVVDRPRLRLEVLAVGSRDRLADSTPPQIIGRARTWHSVTGFVAPRFPKRRRGEMFDSPEKQLLWLAAEVVGSVPRVLAPVVLPAGCWSAFQQQRLAHARSARRLAGGWLMRFSEPVDGPVVLGYGAHFGLGRFDAQDRITS